MVRWNWNYVLLTRFFFKCRNTPTTTMTTLDLLSKSDSQPKQREVQTALKPPANHTKIKRKWKRISIWIQEFNTLTARPKKWSINFVCGRSLFITAKQSEFPFKAIVFSLGLEMTSTKSFSITATPIVLETKPVRACAIGWVLDVCVWQILLNIQATAQAQTGLEAQTMRTS